MLAFTFKLLAFVLCTAVVVVLIIAATRPNTINVARSADIQLERHAETTRVT
jgi:hypothetical protein